MSWFNRVFKKKQSPPLAPPVIPPATPPPLPPRNSPHRAAFDTPDGSGYEAEGVYRADYAVFDSREAGPPTLDNGSMGIIHFDFVHLFPHLSWASETGHDEEYPDGFSYKLLTARCEPSGEFECVILRLLADGSKTILKRFRFPKEQFGVVEAELISTYEDVFSVKFTRLDMSQAHTPEDVIKIITGSRPPAGQPPFLLEHSAGRK